MTDRMLAYHIDLKRAMWKREYLDTTVDRLKAWGFNTLIYEVEDKLRYPGHPAIRSPQAPENAESADFAALCRAKGVEVIPLVQTLGHSEFVLGRPEYAHLREMPDATDQYDPLSEDARALIIDLCDEVIDVFAPREFFHVGGDETWSLGKSEKCASVVEEIGVGGLYLEHMLPLFEHLHGRGLRPIIWADIVLTHPGIIKDIPPYVVLMDWDYWTREERPGTIMVWGGADDGRGNRSVTWEQYQQAARPTFKQHLGRYASDERTRTDGTFRQFYCTDALLDMGFGVLTASANRSYGDTVGIPAHAVHLPNCYYSARKGMTAGMGNLVTSWAVRHCHPETCLLGGFAAAHALGTLEAFDAEALGRAFTADFFGVEMPEFAPAVDHAQVPFRLGRAEHISAARSAFRQGKDPVAKQVSELNETEGVRGAAAHMEGIAAGYAEARKAFAGMKAKGLRNARNLDFWLEGIDLNLFYANFLFAALAGTLEQQASTLLERLERLRENTRTLFAETYVPLGVEDELDLRFGFHEEYLRSIGR